MPDAAPQSAGVTVLRADDRYTTRSPGIEARHCFAYGDHYDPENTGFGPLRAVNDERLDPGAGYPSHHHEDVEIVTWVLGGVLEHADSTGTRGTVRPGTVQHLSAGSGVDHTERNASSDEPLRFVQMMLAPSQAALSAPPEPPAYHDAPVAQERGALHPALTVRAGARLYVAYLAAGDRVRLPAGGDLHLHVTRGAVDLEHAGRLADGDTARLSGPARPGLRATRMAEVLLWHLLEARQWSP